MDYATVKLIHQTAVTLSIAGFALRSVASFAGARWVSGRAAKTVPHIVDTVLLASAVTLAWWLRLNPLVTPWLAAKIVALFVYVGLGMVALNPKRPLATRATAWVGAMLVVGYIVTVALSKSLLGPLA